MITIDTDLRKDIVNRVAEMLLERAFGGTLQERLEELEKTDQVYPYVVRNHSRKKAYVGYAGSRMLRDEYRLAISNQTFNSNPGLAEDIRAQRTEDFTFEDLDPIHKDAKNTDRGFRIVRLMGEGYNLYNTKRTGGTVTVTKKGTK